jgi:protein SCO1/2
VKVSGRSWFQGFGVLFLLIFASAAISAPARGPQQIPVQRRQVKIAIDNFILTDQSGKPFEFKHLNGKVVVAAFAYTTCPDVCPLITAAMRQVQINLSEAEKKRVQLITVTTDPEIDVPKVLAGYAKRYGAELDSWSFLTGDETTLKKVWKNFGVGVKRKARGLVDHTPLTAVVDQRGVLRFAYIGASPDKNLVLNDVRSLLAGR